MSLAFRASGALLVTIAALTAIPDANAGPAYTGGSLPEAAVTGRGYAPTVGVTLEPLAGGRVAFAFDTTLRCGRATTQIRVARTVRWDGAALTANGVARAPFAGRRVRFAWTAAARAEGQRATGSVRIGARRRGTACRGRAPRAFVARLGAAPAGAPSRPAAGARTRRRPTARGRTPARLHGAAGQPRRESRRGALGGRGPLRSRPAAADDEPDPADPDRRRRRIRPARALRRPLRRRLRALSRPVPGPLHRRDGRREAAAPRHRAHAPRRRASSPAATRAPVPGRRGRTATRPARRPRPPRRPRPAGRRPRPTRRSGGPPRPARGRST